MKKCGDCIHADICKEVNGGWFSPKNPAYCKGFKDNQNYVEVVRCKDCKHFGGHGKCHCHAADENGTPIFVREDDFCSYGERREGE